MDDILNKAWLEALRYGGQWVLTPGHSSRSLDGRRLGRRSGSALEFSDYREYRAGDDLRHLDWRVFARSEQLVVKQYSEEIDPRCDIILDHSASMGIYDYKMAAAWALAGVLANAAVNGGFSLQVWHGHDELYKESETRNPGFWHFRDFDGCSQLNETIHSIGEHGGFYNRGVRILISDCLIEGDPEVFLSHLASGARRLIVLELLAHEELDVDLSGPVVLEEPESGRELEIMADSECLKEYYERLNRHRELWQTATRKVGGEFYSFEAGALLQEWQVGELFRHEVLR